MRFWLVLALMTLGSTAHAQQATFERPYWVDRSVIEEIGRSSVDVQADRATFSVTFREVARESRDAMFAASDRARLAAAAVRSRGGDHVQIASGAEIEAIHQEYRNREGERQSTERADQIENYAVSVTLSVTVTDIARVATVRAAAMAAGPQESSDIEYSLSENSNARLRAYRAAVEDAAARARTAATASGAQLGRLLVLQDGQGPCLGRWQSGVSRNGAVQNSVNPVASNSDDEEVVVTGTRVRELHLSAEDIARMQLPADVPPLEVMAQVCAVYQVGP